MQPWQDPEIDITREAFRALAQNELEEEFGEERLIQIARQNRHLSAEELQREIFASVLNFVGRSKLGDDVTIVVLKVLL